MMVLLIGLGIGLVVAVIEMALVGHYEKNKIVLASIGLHWVAIALLMPFIEIGVSSWLKGIFVGVLLTIPLIVLEIPKSRNAVIHTSLFSVVWGVVIAYAHQLLA